jgi:DNA-binding SARP family transcriptional activator/TolB-like protein
MITLRMLGSLTLSAPDGCEFDSVLRRKKRLALLAYLAAARPQGFHRRDLLVGTLWPEFAQARARNALRQAVHCLRDGLGKTVVIARGEEELAIDHTVLQSDVEEFEKYIDAGAHECALAVYRGDFLTGFHLPHALEFQHWLDDERTRLRLAAVAAGLSLAAEAERRGNLLGAVRWATRAVQISPFTESVLRELLSLLDRAGDRAEAVRVYHEFVRRLQDDLEVEPSPETRRVMHQILQRTAPLASLPPVADTGPAPLRFERRVHPRSAAPPDPRAPDRAASVVRVVVLPFANARVRDVDEFSAGITRQLIARLNSVPGLSAVEPSSESRPDHRGLPVAGKLYGSVAETAGRVWVAAWLTDPRTGNDVWADALEDSVENLFDLHDALVERVARALLPRSHHRNAAGTS